jgi:hypothetical protein
MANKHRDIDIEKLRELAWEYILESEDSTKEVAISTGVKTIRERMIPDVRYFLRIWLRKHQFDFYQKTHYYRVLNDPKHPLWDTIKGIDDDFKALGVHILANEGKGVFYGKNFLGMHDKQHIESKNVEKFDFDE